MKTPEVSASTVRHEMSRVASASELMNSLSKFSVFLSRTVARFQLLKIKLEAKENTTLVAKICHDEPYLNGRVTRTNCCSIPNIGLWDGRTNRLGQNVALIQSGTIAKGCPRGEENTVQFHLEL